MQLLVERARTRTAAKRGGGRKPLQLEPGELATIEDAQAPELVKLGEHLAVMEQLNPRAADVLRLRYVAGLSVSEIAHALGISAGTVHNDWLWARARLRIQLDG